MAPLAFKLANPSQPKGKDLSEVPSWLEEHFGKVNSNSSKDILGDVDTTLLKGEPFDYAGYTNYYANGAVYPHGQAVNPFTAKVGNGQKFWENTEDGTNDGFKIGLNTQKNVDSKAFCDSVYMRLINILYVIPDEKQATQTQNQVNKLLREIEMGFQTE